MNKNIKMAIKQSQLKPQLYSTLEKNNIDLSITQRHISRQYRNIELSQYFSLYKIFCKQYRLRNHNQLKEMNQFINKNPTLCQLSQINGVQFCKGIVKSAIIQQFNKGQIVQEKGTPLTAIYILLQGKLASIRNQDNTDVIEQIKPRDINQRLVNIAINQDKTINKKIQVNQKIINATNQHQSYHGSYQQNMILQKFEKDDIFGNKLLCISKINNHTTIALQNTILLKIDINNFFQQLKQTISNKLKNLYSLLKQHPCFCFLESQQIKKIISNLTTMRIQKHNIAYQQGEQTNYLYFLQSGQLTIEKESNLFADNPNQLYMDRRKLMSERELIHKQYLPYANLQNVYNLFPVTKILQIGILNPFCLFGEEQMIQRKPRDTTIRCKSMYATYYTLQIKKISQILNENFPKWLDVINQSVKKKIRYRQNIYANSMTVQNKNNFQGFYQDKYCTNINARRNELKKMNEKIKNSSSTIELPAINLLPIINIYNQYAVSSPLKSSRNQRQNQFVELNFNNKQPERTVEQIPPLYNNFNFYKMLKTKLNKNIHYNKTISQQNSIITEGQQTDTERQNKIQQLKQTHNKQLSILQNSHSWRFVQQKVNKQKKMSKKIGSLKHRINLSTPLIDQKYLSSIKTEIKRIQRQEKKGSFSTSNQITINKSRNNSINTIISKKCKEFVIY